jgi:hypothetical protein
MSWIQTFTGKQFFPLKPRPSDIELRDIAHSLSLQCRFNGHCRVFYSVADHSIRVSRAVPAEHAIWGLLHDAAEAYLKDLPRPIKQNVQGYRELEEKMLYMIAQTYGLSWPMPEEVVKADDVLLATEARDLMEPPPAPWGLRSEPLAETIEPMTAREAEEAFLLRYAELTGLRV